MTAVGWLEIEFVKLEHSIGVHLKMYELIEQAKEMEKQQFADSYIVKWQQEQLCNSEIIQRIRASKSDAEARRIIKSI
jgi:hypothetical protein